MWKMTTMTDDDLRPLRVAKLRWDRAVARLRTGDPLTAGEVENLARIAARSVGAPGDLRVIDGVVLYLHRRHVRAGQPMPRRILPILGAMMDAQACL